MVHTSKMKDSESTGIIKTIRDPCTFFFLLHYNNPHHVINITHLSWRIRRGFTVTLLFGPYGYHESNTFGNTQVTCHVGVPSCGQRHRNVFIDLLLTCTITNTIINDSLASPPCASSPAPFSFAHPPTPVLSVTLCLKPNPVEDQWKGFIRPVHHPSPRGAVDVKSTTPTHPIDYRLTHQLFTCDGANIRKINVLH